MRDTVEISSLRPKPMMRFLYKTPPGRLVLRGVVCPPVSKCVGGWMNTSASRCMIRSFVRKNHIDVSRYDTENVRCYNDFFTRPIRPECLNIGEGLISPCDAKLTVYPIREDSVFAIKGSEYSIGEVLRNPALEKEFAGGWCLIFRLTVDDYHRYHYFDDCVEGENGYINGELYTVQPVAFHHYKVYHRNCREYTVLETSHYGRAVQIEFGATCVGKIENHHVPGPHKKGDEKGRFLFGGSTVMLLLKEAEIDPEILRNTEEGKETVVSVGETIGK